MKFNSLSVFLSLLIITVLPFTAYADNDPVVGPAQAGEKEEVFATYDPPYATTTITNDDRGHIATTAYVKGAYNDTIAAINRLDDSMVLINGSVTSLEDAVLNKRVEIYTTWGGNGTRDVELKNAE